VSPGLFSSLGVIDKRRLPLRRHITLDQAANVLNIDRDKGPKADRHLVILDARDLARSMCCPITAFEVESTTECGIA